MKSLLLVFTMVFSLACHAALSETDLCIYGGTSAGVIAAVQGAMMGKKVVLVEAGQHLGGMSVEGLCGTDIDNQPFQNSPAVGGLALEFYRRVSAQYGRSEAFEAMLVAKRKTRRCGDSSRMWLRLFGRRGSRKRASPCCVGIV
jgi:NADPH-dependent 2,4-dienoyl-CoA reductase/sulfur reductase-like enzyme